VGTAVVTPTPAPDVVGAGVTYSLRRGVEQLGSSLGS
jgi:hypothetical protein